MHHDCAGVQRQRALRWLQEQATALEGNGDLAGESPAHVLLRELTTPQPIPMLMFCPQCGLQHVDAPSAAREWENPPHRSHECQGCGHVWRHADVHTTGVLEIATRGIRDGSPFPRRARRRYKHACPFCGHVSMRSFMGVQENPFCARCLHTRMALAVAGQPKGFCVQCPTCRKPMLASPSVPDHYVCCNNVVELQVVAGEIPRHAEVSMRVKDA